jgi:hypothetical protein
MNCGVSFIPLLLKVTGPNAGEVARSFKTKSMEVMEDSVDGFFEYVFGSFSLTTFVS